ncbi:hypothetical protein [Bdellovibrio bacteriovorus]|uniref:hypothetical protein n=1 Tax=Bdellovibrio bacteriovorus TaxID=959 RepID=UPI0035A885E3
MKTTNKAWYLICAFSILVASCSFKKDDSTTPTADEILKRSQQNDIENLSKKLMSVDDFNFEWVPLEDPNKYNLLISWKQTDVRVDFDDQANRFRLTSTKSPQAVAIPGDTKFTINIRSTSLDGKILFEGSKELISPQDVIIANEYSLIGKKKIEANRVFIKNGVITTFDYPFILSANEVIAENAVIQTFPEGARAPFERSGRSASSIKIEARQIRGSLKISLRGENGGHGKSSYRNFESHPGCATTYAGNGGGSGSAEVYTDDDQSLKLSYEIQPGQPGNAGTRGLPKGTPHPQEGIRHAPCSRSEENAPINTTVGSPGKICLFKYKDNRSYQCFE